jgi:hypothetical protein
MKSPNWKEVDVIRDPEGGVICVITEREGDEHPYHSFTFMREFEREGGIQRTGYLSRRHTVAVRRLLTRLEEWLDKAVDKSTAARAAQRR